MTTTQPRREARRLVGYLVVGGASTILNLGVVTALTAAVGWSYLPSALVAYEIGVLFSFLLMERFAFRDMAQASGGWFVRIMRFHATYLLGAALTLAIGDTLVAIAQFKPTIAHACAIAVTTSINFLVLRLWAYRSSTGGRSNRASSSSDATSPSPAQESGMHGMTPHPHDASAERVFPNARTAPSGPGAYNTRAALAPATPLPRFGPTSDGDLSELASTSLSEDGYSTDVRRYDQFDAHFDAQRSAWESAQRSAQPETRTDTAYAADPWLDSQSSTLKRARVAVSTIAAHADPAEPEAQAPARAMLSQIPAAIREMRIKQWTKNGLVVLAMVFAHTLTDAPTLLRVGLAFLAFSLAASSIYTLNDLADAERDRHHPKKRHRPIASGALSVPGAVLLAIVCVGCALVISGVILTTPFVGAVDHGRDPFAQYGGGGLLFVLALSLYVAQNIAYSLWLKHIVLWDVFSIAFGFTLRALAGAFAADVYISPWFYLCVIFLSLFLALSKRRSELAQSLGSGTMGSTRKILQAYSLQLLDQLIVMVVTCAILTYSLYTLLGEPQTHKLMITIPFITFGVARYLYLVYVKAEGEQPDQLLFQDRQILGAVVCCIACVLVIIYAPFLAALLTTLAGSVAHLFHA